MNERILIVEDEAITALDLKYSLEELGYEVIDTVDTGQDAIDTAAETIPDVVLMDIKLKGDMEGIEAAEVISELRIPPSPFASIISLACILLSAIFFVILSLLYS